MDADEGGLINVDVADCCGCLGDGFVQVSSAMHAMVYLVHIYENQTTNGYDAIA